MNDQSYDHENKQSDEFKTWIYPDLELNRPDGQANNKHAIWDPNDQDRRKVRWPTADELESIRKSAYEEGFNEGKNSGFSLGKMEGLKAGQQEINQKIAYLSEVTAKLMQPIDRRDKDTVNLLVSFIIKFSENIILRELKINVNLLTDVISQAIDLLPLGSDSVRIRLNPKDLDLIKSEIENFCEYQAEWKLVSDAKISQGGCTVESESLMIDATVEKRIFELSQQLYHELAQGADR